MSATSNFTFPLTHSHKSSLNSLHASSVCHLPFLFPSHIPFSRSLYVDISCFHLHPLCNPLAILRLDPSLMSFHLLLFLSVSFSLFLAISKKKLNYLHFLFYHTSLISLSHSLIRASVASCSRFSHLHFYPPLFAHPLCTAIYFQNL